MDLQAAFSARYGRASVGTRFTEMKSGHSYCVCLSKSEIDLVCKCYGRMSMLVLVSLWWAPLARMVRGEVLQIREKGYITAAKANDLSDVVIIFRHAILNVMSPVVAYESKAYSESVRAELSDTTLLAAWKDVFSDTLPACEDKMLKTVDVGTGPGFFPIVLGQMGYPCIGAGLYVSHPVK